MRVRGYLINFDISTKEYSIRESFTEFGKFNHRVYTTSDALFMILFDECSKKKVDKALGIRYWSVDEDSD